jgi:hypothetical protein
MSSDCVVCEIFVVDCRCSGEFADCLYFYMRCVLLLTFIMRTYAFSRHSLGVCKILVYFHSLIAYAHNCVFRVWICFLLFTLPISATTLTVCLLRCILMIRCLLHRWSLLLATHLPESKEDLCELPRRLERQDH